MYIHVHTWTSKGNEIRVESISRKFLLIKVESRGTMPVSQYENTHTYMYMYIHVHLIHIYYHPYYMKNAIL